MVNIMPKKPLGFQSAGVSSPDHRILVKITIRERIEPYPSGKRLYYSTSFKGREILVDYTFYKNAGRTHGFYSGWFPPRSACYCGLGSWREDGLPELMHVFNRKHPIARGIKDFCKK